MPTSKRLTRPLLLATLLAFGLIDAHADAGSRSATANPVHNKKVEDLVRANASETRENNAEAPQGSPDAPPTSGAHKKGVFDSFDAFPAAAAKRAIQPRAVSENVAAQLAARMPQYTPPPDPKKPSSDAGPTSPAQNEQAEDLTDLRDEDRPQNQILRLPDYVVREKKPPVFRERDIHSPSSLAALTASRYLSETGQALNRYTLPLFGGGAQAYALARYEEDERLRNIRDLNDTARDLGQLQNAETAVSGSEGSTWGIPPASSGASARRSGDTEANLRRLIRDTTSRRATESPTKLAQ